MLNVHDKDDNIDICRVTVVTQFSSFLYVCLSVVHNVIVLLNCYSKITLVIKTSG